MRKRPHHQSNESAKDQGHFTAQSTAKHEKLRQKFIRDLFPKKAATCFECGAKLTSSTRKRIVTFHTVPKGLVASGHQLCKSCAALMQAGQYQKMPKINSDIAAARFQVIGADVPCAGGMQ